MGGNRNEEKQSKTKLLVALCGCIIGTSLGLLIVHFRGKEPVEVIPVSPDSPIAMDNSAPNPNIVLTDEEQASLKEIQEDMKAEKKRNTENAGNGETSGNGDSETAGDGNATDGSTENPPAENPPADTAGGNTSGGGAYTEEETQALRQQMLDAGATTGVDTTGVTEEIHVPSAEELGIDNSGITLH